jgi:predicted enzyme related to lactoylglutathione lyase
MGNPIVHVDIIGPDPDALRHFYRELFGWDADAGAPVAPQVSEPRSYSFIEPGIGAGPVPAGIGGGPMFAPRAMFYVGVEDVEEALAAAVRLGGRRLLGPVLNAAGGVVVGHLEDPAGNVLGVAAPA